MTLQLSDRTQCITALDAMLQRCPGANEAMLASSDGRPFAERSRVRTGVDGGRLAAMASSLAALGNGVLRELSAGNLDHILVEGGGGKLVVCCVPGSRNSLVLAGHAGNEARLGLVLGQAKSCALAIGQIMARSAASASR